MYNSIELRYPFLDHELIETSFDLKKNNLINDHKNKILLRKLVRNYKIKKKRHINSPQTEWMYKKLMHNYLEKIKNESPIYEYYFDKRKTVDFINNFFSLKQKNSFKLWQIINLDLFLRNQS